MGSEQKEANREKRDSGRLLETTTVVKRGMCEKNRRKTLNKRDNGETSSSPPWIHSQDVV